MKIIALVSALLISTSAFADKVCAVHDGDTFTLCSGQKVRVWGIDAPELKQPMGEQSRNFLTSKIENQDVDLDYRGKSYKRWVCQVSLKGQDIESLMVRSGWAFDSDKYSKGRYSPDEAQAKRQHIGVWQLPNGGIRPWAYRHQHNSHPNPRSN